MTHWAIWIKQKYSEHSILQQQNKHFFQVHIEYSSEQIIYQATKQVSTNLKTLKSYHESFLITIMLQNQKSITRKKSGKNIHTLRLNNILLNREWVNHEIKEEIKTHMKTNENENTQSKIFGMQQNYFKKGSLQQYKPTSRSKKTLKQPNLTCKAARKRRTNKTPKQQEDGYNKIIAEIKSTVWFSQLSIQLLIHEIEPYIRLCTSTQSQLWILSLSLCLPLPYSLSFSPSQK